MTNEQIMLAFIGFMSSVVVFFTALIGYFKVLKPARKEVEKSNGDTVMRVDRLSADLSLRVSHLEAEVARLTQELTECEHERTHLKRENFTLMREVIDLRKD